MSDTLTETETRASFAHKSFETFTLKCCVKKKPFKRFFDIVFSFCALFFLSPVFLVLSLIVKLSSEGPVFYGHKRVGRSGKFFFCYKFRTMYKDADQRLKTLLEENEDLKKEWQASFKLKKDPRITPIGKFLRKTSLDELPQFWNVLRGDLSVVGPRPVVEQEVIQYLGEKASKILSVRPGITGLWQVSGRSDTCYKKRIQMDEEYIENRSFSLDLKIIAKTIPSMISSKGAY